VKDVNEKPLFLQNRTTCSVGFRNYLPEREAFVS